MDLDFGFFAVAIPAVLLAGISKGGFGSGAAFAAAPLLALVIEPQQAIGLMLPLLMIMDLTGLRPYWRKWDWPNARALMLGAIPGVAVGIWLTGDADPDLLRALIGLVALGFVAFQLARMSGLLDIANKPFRSWEAMAWGSLGGFTSFISHAGGPPVAVHLLGQGLGKTAYQGTTVIVFWWVNLIKLPAYIYLGFFTGATLTANLMLVPVAVVGVLIGVWGHSKIPESSFMALMIALLGITGSKLVWDGLT